MRMFFGVISFLSGSGTCTRRQRLRSAMATARLASSWPMMCLSSSWTISRGVISDMSASRAAGRVRRQLLDHEVLVGVVADLAGDGQRVLGDRASVEIRVPE